MKKRSATPGVCGLICLKNREFFIDSSEDIQKCMDAHDESRIGNETFWQSNEAAFQRQEYGLNEGFITTLQLLQNDDSEIVTESNKPLVESAVMYGR